MNTGLFLLGLVSVLLGVASDVFNYYDTYALFVIMIGFILLVMGALIPGVTTSVEKSEISVPERRTKKVVTED